MKDYKLSELKEDCIRCHIENIRECGTDVCFFCKHNDYCDDMFGRIKPCNWSKVEPDKYDEHLKNDKEV